MLEFKSTCIIQFGTSVRFLWRVQIIFPLQAFTETRLARQMMRGFEPNISLAEVISNTDSLEKIMAESNSIIQNGEIDLIGGNEFLLSKNADAQKLLAIFLLLFSVVCLEKQPDFEIGVSLMLAWSADQQKMLLPFAHNYENLSPNVSRIQKLGKIGA